MMITIESKDLVITRVDNDTFKVSFGDVEMPDPDTFELKYGETITIPISSVLIDRTEDKALLCNITGI